MKLLTSLTITIALAVPLLAQTPKRSLSIAEAQARQELNEAARLYTEGKFAEAQASSERALLLDPQNKAAPFFVARTIHAQYKPGDFTSDNVAKAREAIIAYKRILERLPSEDESFKAVTYLYGALKEDELLREWVLQRAGNVLIANDKRSEAYVVLASKDWDCSFKITELPGNKVTTVNGDKASFRYQMPKERVEFEQARECANRGLEMANAAITLMPENESAWANKANIMLELEKLADMLGEAQHKRELHRQYEEALRVTTTLSERSKSKP